MKFQNKLLNYIKITVFACCASICQNVTSQDQGVLINYDVITYEIKGVKLFLFQNDTFIKRSYHLRNEDLEFNSMFKGELKTGLFLDLKNELIHFYENALNDESFVTLKDCKRGVGQLVKFSYKEGARETHKLNTTFPSWEGCNEKYSEKLKSMFSFLNEI